jgi:hypothetical protein
MLRKLTAVLLLLASCHQQKTESPQTNHEPPDPPQIHEDCTDWETGGSTLPLPQFIGHFEIPDRYFVCGDTDPTEQDYYWFISQDEVLMNLALDSEADTTLNLNVWGRSLIQDEGETIIVHDLVYSFIGDPGSLQVTGFPVPQSNYGFVVGITSLNNVSDYQLEIWPF